MKARVAGTASVFLTAALLAVSPGYAAQRIEDEVHGLLPKQKALVVQLGVASPEMMLRFAGTSNILYGIEPDAAAAQRATAEAMKAGAQGRAWVERADVRILPMVNYSANVILVDDWKRMSDLGLSASEILRVLAPEGVGCVGQRAGAEGGVAEDQLKNWLGKAEVKNLRVVKTDGLWIVFQRTRPETMDEWTHELHDSTRNPASNDRIAGPPEALHWIGGIPYTWQISHYRTAGNRLFVFYSGGKGMSRFGTFKEDIRRVEALDAFTGTYLWFREYPSPKKGLFPVLYGDKLIMQVGDQLSALDGATGDIVLKFPAAGEPISAMVCDGVLVCVHDAWLRGLDAKTAKLLWEAKPAQDARWVPEGKGSRQVTGWDFYNPIAAEGMALIIEKYVKADATNKSLERIVGIDVKTGARAWSFDDPAAIEGHHKRWFAYGKRLFMTVPSGAVFIPLDKEKSVVKVPFTTIEKRKGGAPGNSMGVDGLFWIREAGFLVGENADTTAPRAPKVWVGIDPETGKIVRKVGYEPGIPGWRGRCYADVGAPNFIYSENGEFMDLRTGKASLYRVCRGHCGWGPLIGNGLFYTSPTWCIFCYPMLHGAIAVGPKAPPATPVKDEDRLEKGPAYVEAPPPAKAFAATDWPTYRQNFKRTSGTTASVPLPLAAEPLWKHSFGEYTTGPVIADGRAYVAVVNQGRIYALDEKTGEVIWSAAAGPRIDSPPSRYGDLLLFGSHDGYVYALRASDGALAWRFCVAPERRKMVCGDRLESSWPVPGASLVHNGVLYALGGHIAGADGGMHMYALNPQTGIMKWHHVVDRTNNPKLATGGDPKLYYWVEAEGQLPNNHLVAHDNTIRLPDQHFYWDFRAEDGGQIVPDRPSGVHLKSFSSAWPWYGYDRPTFANAFHGMQIHPEHRHPYEAGTMMAYAETNSVGIVCKRVRAQFTEIIPTRVDDADKNWDGKTRGEVPWQPPPLKTDIHALVVAGDTAFIGGMDLVLRPEKGRIMAVSMKDGKELQQFDIPGIPTYDALAAANGKLFITLQNGTVMCFGQAK